MSSRGTRPCIERPDLGTIFLTRHYVDRVLLRFSLADDNDRHWREGWQRALVFGSGILRTADFNRLQRKPNGRLVYASPGDYNLYLCWGDWTVPIAQRNEKGPRTQPYWALTIHPQNHNPDPWVDGVDL